MVKTTTVGQRFSQLIQALGMSKNAFALSLDKTATVIQHIVEERNKPGFDLLCKVFEVYPNVSKDWMLEGFGQMYNTPAAAESAPESVVAPAVAATPAPVFAAPQPTDVPAAPVPAPTVPRVAATVAAAPALAPEPVPSAPSPLAEASVPAAPAAPPAAAPASVATPPAGWEAALYAQQLQHQLALAELRNQHLLEQQKMLQQMVELLRQSH